MSGTTGTPGRRAAARTTGKGRDVTLITGLVAVLVSGLALAVQAPAAEQLRQGQVERLRGARQAVENAPHRVVGGRRCLEHVKTAIVGLDNQIRERPTRIDGKPHLAL